MNIADASTSLRHLRNCKSMNKTRNTLPPHIRKQAFATLNSVVAELFDLFARIKQAHWNVPPSISGMSDWIYELADVHAASSEHVRPAIKKLTDAEDFGAADLLTDILRVLDLQLWLLEAHLKHQEPST